MTLTKGKHIEKEINEIRCRVVESGISKSRAEFLKTLLEHNGYEVHIEEEPPKPPAAPKPTPVPKTDSSTQEKPASDESSVGNPEPTSDESSVGKPEPEPEPTFIIGVTDIIFNPVVAVYNRALRTLDDKHVTADYWNQKTTNAEPNYWDRSKKEWI